jgi:arylsulfatase A-like enzyme
MTGLPHIIYILSDEHCGNAMSHMGDPNVSTPHMDRLATEGVSFSKAYANCPVCTPSRGTIFSGRHAHSGPVQGFFDVYKTTAPSIATLLQEQGYHTSYFGKWHCGGVFDQMPPAVRANRNDYPTSHNMVTRTPERHRAGFQDWFAFEVNNAPFKGFYYHQDEVNPRFFKGYQTDSLTDLAIEYIETYDKEEPLFLVLSVEPPHFPLEAPEGNLRFNPDDLKVPASFNTTEQHSEAEAVEGEMFRDNIIYDTEERRNQLAVYYAMVENLDDNIGRLHTVLETVKRFQNNTLLVYISDHGDFMGARGLINEKVRIYEESVRIPYVFHWPGHIPSSGIKEELISLVDLVPTTLGLINAPVPSHIQGVDMAATVLGKDSYQQNVLLLEMHGIPRWNLDYVDWRGLVTEQWKYCFYETGHEELFDLHNDPSEEVNLSKSDPDMCSKMREKLLLLLQETREPYFDVLIEHGVTPQQTRDISEGDTSRLAPFWKDGSVRRSSK